MVADVDEVELTVATKIRRKIGTTVHKISLVVFKCLSRCIFENLENDNDPVEKGCMIIYVISLSDKKAVKYKVMYTVLVMVAVVVGVLVILTEVVVVLVLLRVGVVIPLIVVKIVVDLIVDCASGLGIVRIIINAAIAVASRRAARRDKSIHAGEHRQQ